MEVKLMSWNIWSGKNWKKIIDFTKKNNIDLIGFQEVDNNLKRTNFVDVAKEIADALGFHYAYSPSMKTENGQFGNAIVSRFPIEENKVHFLSSSEKYDGSAQTEPRTLLETKIKINKKIISFMTLHLGYSREFKTTEIKLKQIENVVKEIKNKDNLILVGDFNSPPENKEINEIKKYLIDTDQNNKLKTWTTYNFEYDNWKVPAGLNYKIDYIFVSKDIQFKEPTIDNNKISDHVPVIVAIEI